MLNCEPLPIAVSQSESAAVSHQATEWSEEETNELIHLWIAGCSYGVIRYKLQAKFGVEYSRSAISGKRKRLGLPKRPTAKQLSIELYGVPSLPAKRPRKNKPAPTKHKRPRFKNHPQYQDLLDRMITLHERGKTPGHIVSMLGLSRAVVYWHLLANGCLHLGNRSNNGTYLRNGRIIHPVDEKDVRRYVELRLQGLTVAEIARRVGRSAGTVRYWLAREAIREDAL